MSMSPAGLQGQRGAVALLVAAVLLFGMTMGVFFANSSFIFEQKTSANQYRSTRAMEAAEAGIEWAVANLNHGAKIGTTCATLASPTSGDRTFRSRYLDNNNDGTLGDMSSLTPYCTWSGSAWSCSCITSAPGSNSSSTTPAFKVSFQAVGSDPTMVRVVSTGCTNYSNTLYPCTATDSTIESTATVSQIFKILPGLATPPAAPLTAKGNVDFGANAITVTNTDTATNGITINAGGSISGFVDSGTVKTVPGSPVQSSLVGQDSSLNSMSDDQMFQTFFGQSKASFQNSPSTKQITCPNACADTMESTVNAGYQVIWVNGDMSINSNNTIGSEANPVIIVVDGTAQLNGNITIYGLVYATAATWDNTGGGTAKIYGGLIAEGNFTTTGTPDPTYDPAVFNNLKQSTGPFTRVLGSWKDF